MHGRISLNDRDEYSETGQSNMSLHLLKRMVQILSLILNIQSLGFWEFKILLDVIYTMSSLEFFWAEIEGTVNFRLQQALVFFSVTSGPLLADNFFSIRSGPLLADNCYELYGLGFVKFYYFYLKSLCDAYASSHMYHGAFCKHISRRSSHTHCFFVHLTHSKCSPSMYSFLLHAGSVFQASEP